MRAEAATSDGESTCCLRLELCWNGEAEWGEDPTEQKERSKAEVKRRKCIYITPQLERNTDKALCVNELLYEVLTYRHDSEWRRNIKMPHIVEFISAYL